MKIKSVFLFLFVILSATYSYGEECSSLNLKEFAQNLNPRLSEESWSALMLSAQNSKFQQISRCLEEGKTLTPEEQKFHDTFSEAKK